MTMALTGKVAPYKRGAGPMPPEVYHVPFPAPHLGVSVEDTLKALAGLFRVDVDPQRVAAILIEPVQGEGGFHEAPAELLIELRRICDEQGILLIADEVQSGFGRTGRMFGIENSGVEPDLVTIAKSLGGGFPISGIIGRAALMDALEPGGLGGTYAGNPVSCAAALAVLDIFADEDLLKRANVLGARLKSRLAKIQSRNDVATIQAIRGPGAMIAFDLADAATAQRAAKAALAEGLIILTCGVYGTTMRVLVPLTVSDEVVEEGMAALERALVAVA